MFAGHVGAALVIASVERRVNVGAFITAAFLLDILLWIFVLLGWESVSFAPDFARSHQPLFTFPYSHGLVASIGWSVVTAGAAWIACARFQAPRWPLALLVAAAVFSHWLLDVLVHRPELPLAGSDSPAFGLAWWDHLPAALLVETGIVLIGLALFARHDSLSRPRSLALAALSFIVLTLTVVGMTTGGNPPSAAAMASSSLGAIVLTCAIAYGIGKRRPG